MATVTKTSLKKTVNSRCFKLYHAYSISCNSSNVEDSLGVGFQRTVTNFRKKTENCCLVFQVVLDKTGN